MKKLPILLFMLLLNARIIFTMHNENDMYVKIPKDSVLRDRFDEIMLGHFFSKADKIMGLAGEEVNILIVLGAVNIALLTYAKSVDRQTASFLQELKNDILEILLADFPESFRKLKEIMLLLEKEQELQKKRLIKLCRYQISIFNLYNL